jgi:hypothetical protein
MPSHRQRNAPLERVNGGRQRRLPDNPHQHLWLFLAVYVAFPALRATVAVVQVLVRDLHLLCADEAPSSIAPVSARRWRDGIRCVAVLRQSAPSSSTAPAFSVLRGRTRHGSKASLTFS